VDFKNTLVLMTSNIGSKLVLRGGRMGFGESEGEQAFHRLEEEIIAELRRNFSPEFINRLDEVIVFNPLSSEDLRAIVELQIDDVNETLRERGLRVELDDPAKEWLLERAGVDPSTGARPLRRTIQRYIQDPVSEILLSKYGEPIELIVVGVKGEELDFQVQTDNVLVKER
ncbi:MAG TPA: AAA family ATPase, partial [Desulfuromonadales bacterium]|nr:AAA family ATPase [Desulfuromonadales bacterium]